MDTYEWMELDRLNARLDALQSRREAAAKNRIGLLRQIDEEILRAEGQRARLVTHLTQRLIRHAAA